jgi:hypothetical protein
MPCIPIPEVPLPTLPDGISLGISTPPVQAEGGVDICCINAAFKVDLPPVPLGGTLQLAAAVAVLRAAKKAIAEWRAKLTIPCPRE